MVKAMTKVEVDVLKETFKKQLFKKEYIAYGIECEKKLNQPPYETVIKTFDGYGNEHNIPAKGPGKILRHVSYHQAVHSAQEQPASDQGFEGMLSRVTDAPPPTPPNNCCLYNGRKEEYEKLTENWLQSSFYQPFIDRVEEKVRRMTEVKSVACFGLGRLMKDMDLPGSHIITNYLQHIVALKIRNLIEKVQKGKVTENIPIYTQDPAYCTNCKSILEKELGFQVMESNSGYLKVDANSFVITCAPAAPVRQIIGDLTKDSIGPAGMLCQPIDGDGVETAENIVDMPSPSIEQFALHAHKNDMKIVFRNDHSSDSSDEEGDMRNTVFYDEKYPSVIGSIFTDFALYFKKKP
ncbi:hypothetical protein BDU57DRAFT_592139 [Ampelomyces quisqualis]|uniref:SRR1-like domain-containing protein n=1 Tax=Ampelomyces quisqualis TaxID=50730 RepID=A0A6A5R299_AMPQU|nr:hypothetical protein BDU57DRAFT_592139 [Ampelomyces quisqualis]